jgi:glutathione peroxidase
MPVASLLEIPLTRNDGQSTTLDAFRGKVLLLVNVASQCGLTSQYKGLERLYASLRDRGFEILAFPANDFAGQEPGTDDEIRAFCTTSFGVSFPLFQKTSVTGANAHPLYQALVAAQPAAIIGKPDFRAGLESFLSSTGSGAHTNPAPGVLWNFEKFLLNRDGEVIARFAPDVSPEDPRLVEAIEAALQQS